MARHVGGRVLDAGDSGHLGEPQHGVVGEVGHRAPGHVVEDQRQVDALGDGAEVPVEAFLRRLVVVRHHRQAARRARLLRVRGELDRLGVELAPVPAITGTRPRTASTAVLINRQCSSKSTVGDSPVVPTMTIPAVPLSMWNSISRDSAARSSAPPSCIGVTIATMLPVNGGGGMGGLGAAE